MCSKIERTSYNQFLNQTDQQFRYTICMHDVFKDYFYLLNTPADLILYIPNYLGRFKLRIQKHQ